MRLPGFPRRALAAPCSRPLRRYPQPCCLATKSCHMLMGTPVICSKPLFPKKPDPCPPKIGRAPPPDDAPELDELLLEEAPEELEEELDDAPLLEAPLLDEELLEEAPLELEEPPPQFPISSQMGLESSLSSPSSTGVSSWSSSSMSLSSSSPPPPELELEEPPPWTQELNCSRSRSASLAETGTR